MQVAWQAPGGVGPLGREAPSSCPVPVPGLLCFWSHSRQDVRLPYPPVSTYLERVRTVYVPKGSRGVRFHRSSDCIQLTCRGAETKQIELSALTVQQPCKTCFPDAPVARSAHRYCYVCDTGKTRPCEHNGGVRVPMTRTRRSRSPYMDKGETYIRYQWVWPEHAHFFLN